MKAFLLAAGKGSRLGDLTKDTPKCLLKFGGQTMLEYWINTLKYYGINNILINTHYLSEQVEKYCRDMKVDGVTIKTVFEKELLGTAKTLWENRYFINDGEDFLIVYVDTFIQNDLKKMISCHKISKKLLTVGIYKPKNLKDQGVLKIEDGRIVDVKEKENSSINGVAFAGIVVASYQIYRHYRSYMIDFAKDWLPYVKYWALPYSIDGLVMDIGSPERYQEAQKIDFKLC